MLAFAACEGSSSTGDAGAGERPMGTGGSIGTGGSGIGGRGGSGMSPGDGGIEVAPPPPPPPINPSAKKLLPARSQMLGLHRSSCSYGATSMPAGAPRWCAISRPGTTLGSLELWVLNVTQAAAGAAGAVKCDGTSPHCVKLTGNLFGAAPDAGPAYPTAHRFYGDTLIYYANATSAPSELYKGPVFAWKPGWTEGKQIASGNGVLCSGHSRADVAVCIENISAPGVEPVTWDVHAGRIDAGPMKKVSQIFPVHSGTEASQWGSGFTVTGEHFVFSTPTTGAPLAPETLFVIPTAMIGTAMPTMVAPAVSRWTLSADGTKWFYLKDYNYNRQGEPSGTLYVRDFPMGATETRLAAPMLLPGGTTGGVGTYQVLFDAMDKDAGLGVLTNLVAGRGDYKILKNPAGPLDATNIVPVVTDISTLPVYSDDLRFHYFGKALDEQVGTTDSWIVKADGTGACQLTPPTTVASSLFGFPFNQSGGLVFWMDKFDSATDSGEGWSANPEGCAGKAKFSDAIDFWFVDGDKALVYSDQSDGRFVTLQYRTAVGTTLGPQQTMQKQADRLFAILPNYEGMMFSITSSNPEADGVYYLSLPPSGAPAGGADAGVGDAAAGN